MAEQRRGNGGRRNEVFAEQPAIAGSILPRAMPNATIEIT